ncbi:hypothetical protein HHL17_21330 [Chitinophaga sp. G-6-1-13]|uniref:Uncharacterized protein n=1 Tax=Chitinophaga fulva TaxID=2728842 RepID=A0A848GMB4_9BACT|nr:hypothetical protein [Chitinophaga fulva]NML39755.1 hypothetical protein [Chitinophaga fulva]
MKTKFWIFALAFLYLSMGTAHAQQSEERRIKIELMVKTGNSQVVAVIRSFTVSYNRTLNTPVQDSVNGKPGPADAPRGHYLSADFEKQSIPLLRAFMQNKKGLDGEITVTDAFGKLPGRKIAFKSAMLETMNDQVTGDYGSAFMTLSCEELIIDGVKLEYY